MLQSNIILLTHPWSASTKHNSLNSSMKCFNQMSTQIAFLTRENNGGVMRFKIFILPRLYYIHKVLVWEKNNNFNIFFHRLKLPDYQTLMHDYQTFLHDYQTFLHDYQTFLKYLAAVLSVKRRCRLILSNNSPPSIISSTISK